LNRHAAASLATSFAATSHPASIASAARLHHILRPPAGVLPPAISTPLHAAPPEHSRWVEAYIAQHGLDEKCATKLMALAPAEQLQVMARDVSAARNVSAVVSANIQQVASNRAVAPSQSLAMFAPVPLSLVAPPMQSPSAHAGFVCEAQAGIASMGSMHASAVEAYIARHRLDSNCANHLRALTPMEQTQVMSIDVSAARNVSAVVESNITKIGRTSASGTKRARSD